MVILDKSSYLADTVFEQIDNNEDNSTYLHQYSGDTPYLLELNRVPKRYVTNLKMMDITICLEQVSHQTLMKKSFLILIM